MEIKKLAASRIKKAYPLLEKNDFVRPQDLKEGDITELVDAKGQYVATAYIGFENRSVGYVLSLKKRPIDQEFYGELFKNAQELRKPLYAQNETTAFRVFNGEGDGLGGLNVDYYQGFYILSWFSKGITQIKEPIIEAFTEVFSDFQGIYEKYHFQKADVQSHHSLGDQAPEPLIIRENGIQYATYLNEGLMTGIFLDQRYVRRAIMNEYGLGRRVLNLFSYTGAFSVAAAMGGASQTVSIDVANRSKGKTMEQFQVNGLDPADHEIRVIDTESYLNYAIRHQLKFGLIVIDPPTFARFANNKTFRVEEDYPQMIERALQVLENQGYLILSTNAWKLSRPDFYGLVQEGFGLSTAQGTFIEEFGLPEDFPSHQQDPESSYLKVLIFQKN